MTTPPRRLQTQGEAIAVLSTQMVEMIKDMNDLRGELRDHREEHRQEATDRAAARRRLWGAVVVLVASIDGPVLAILFSRR